MQRAVSDMVRLGDVEAAAVDSRPEILANLATSHALLGEPAKARRWLDEAAVRAIELAPGEPRWLALAGVCRAAGRLGGALVFSSS